MSDKNGTHCEGRLKPNGVPGTWKIVGAGNTVTDVTQLISDFIASATGPVTPVSAPGKLTLTVGRSSTNRGDIDQRVQKVLTELSRGDVMIRVKDGRLVIAGK